MPEKDEYAKFKNYERKTESLFMIYADFESTLVPEYNEKENPKESYTNKHQKHIVAAMAIHVDDKFSKPFKTYLDKNAIYNFINNMIKESKYCREVMKKNFLKQLAMTKEDNEDFKKSTKSQICDNVCVNNDVKVRDYCHITGKYRGSANRYCNINLKLNHKIPVISNNLENYNIPLLESFQF